ncbi:uncharacterized protein LOC101742872 [Bombyx mori]|uniref:Spherulin-2A n=1 Tax=Bombyx mori TaxID=7091 RepID=A0A8R2AFG3_BOMMO|nr:uncharacterized protein LOC101742872 [Bombyx mori]XP_021209117.1 uncharacterized protein LOC101742872 [Bombyx mori]
MKLRILTIILLPIIEAKIAIEIIMSKSDNQIQISGCNSDVISDTETLTFNLTDANLKNAVEKLFGRKPDDVFLKSPTPWGDLYETYSWEEVERHFRPQRAIKNIIKNKMVVLSQQFYNNQGNSTVFSVKIEDKIENYVASKWTKAQELTVNDYITYDIKLDDFPRILFIANYNQNAKKYEVVKIDANINVHLEPNQHIKAELAANITTIEVIIDYEAHLTGLTAVNYVRKYDNHHFWGLDINTVMAASRLKPTVKVMEEITIEYYSDAKIIITDQNTSDVLNTYSVNFLY